MNGNGNGGVSWSSVIDRGLDGWFAYLNRPSRDQTIGTVGPFGPSASDTRVAVLSAQLDAQQQSQKMLLYAAVGVVLLYVLSR